MDGGLGEGTGGRVYEQVSSGLLVVMGTEGFLLLGGRLSGLWKMGCVFLLVWRFCFRQ